MTRERFGFEFEQVEGNVFAGFRGLAHRGGDEGSDAVDRHGTYKPFGQAIGNRRHPHGILFLQVGESDHILVRFVVDPFRKSSPPCLGRFFIAATNEHVVDPHHRFQVPRNAIVFGTEPQEVEQRVQQFTAIRIASVVLL